MYSNHVTLRLHTGGLYLTNYVTSEGIWLHQILFRGFIAKGVNTYVPTTFLFKKTNNLTSLFFNLTSPIWTLLCVSIE